ncbi:G protein-coupled receptor, rhodopsin-like family and GPCR, rhodopsin-like, 7TM domain-containing protein [Strongyloides ratti]|uniref:G protein-coupled receptor, rhodopsin-like family and GPCR, rhodopsin-like, 7TM domain-containing protein n=1 Tax=Strongyloides ratti TaxID=34506 RepID=A0A090KUP2_STRRB|nr:G protein-coupled receptor, rhodopsin-like family and GPCR, rhodopsin-like, 7TM domain-containing protein [Strongyloides ratti]CEF61195.1 G protein-coupled receptor, rhodopsin-like family and GPCR, rhodopsin-like, 7TM domain-containing protein [Strongyloides ratti]
MGVFLNFICIYVFRQHSKEHTAPVIHYYLITLTLWQTAVLLNGFLLYSFPNMYRVYFGSLESYQLFYPYIFAGANITMVASVWVILVLTIDRYLALCKPLKHRYIGKRSRVKRIMILVSVLAFFYNIPRFFEIVTNKTCTNVNGTINCIYYVDRTPFAHNSLYHILYKIISQLLLVSLIPCFILFILTLKISLAIRHAILRRKKLCPDMAETSKVLKKSKPVSREHKANIMLVLIIVKFLISTILPTACDIIEKIIGAEVFQRSYFATIVVDISNFLIVLNCSTNFWVFLFYGQRFRKYCKRIFSNKLLRNAERYLESSFEIPYTRAQRNYDISNSTTPFVTKSVSYRDSQKQRQLNVKFSINNLHSFNNSNFELSSRYKNPDLPIINKSSNISCYMIRKISAQDHFYSFTKTNSPFNMEKNI